MNSGQKTKGEELSRSVLYVPGHKQRAIEKVRSLHVDGIIFDLEDAVADPDKEMARVQVCKALIDLDFGERTRVVRVNDPATANGQADLEAVVAARPDALLVPKLRGRTELEVVFEEVVRLASTFKIAGPDIWAMIETPQAVFEIRDIAKLAIQEQSRLTMLVMGTNDLMRETRVEPSHAEPWLMTCVLAAKACGLRILDGVHNALDDEAGFRLACEKGRAMGMDGKTLIHPRQIEPCNELFSPTRDELEQARQIVAAFEQPDNRDKSLLVVGGQMVERLHYEMACDTIAIAKRIAQR